MKEAKNTETVKHVCIVVLEGAAKPNPVGSPSACGVTRTQIHCQEPHIWRAEMLAGKGGAHLRKFRNSQQPVHPPSSACLWRKWCRQRKASTRTTLNKPGQVRGSDDFDVEGRGAVGSLLGLAPTLYSHEAVRSEQRVNSRISFTPTTFSECEIKKLEIMI